MNIGVVFKAYDIRGRTDNGDLDETLYERTGVALVQLLDAEAVAVGRDCRSTSDSFFEALASGITAAGADVLDLGEVPTDAVYYYSGANSVPGAVITASHNPPEYNGLKLCRPGALPIGEETGLTEIRSAVQRPVAMGAAEPGTISTIDAVPAYIDHLLSIVPEDSVGALSVAADGGNGMAGVALERVFDRLEASLEGLYLEPDGTFPNHPADPLVAENLEDLQELMTGSDYDLGVAFDGDADRAFFLDDAGAPLSGSTVTALIARRLLEDAQGSAVVHNLITSKAVPEIIRESGGRPIRTKVGHSFIKQVMAESEAIFGGEHSGHYYFRDNFRADSGMLAMLVLMRVLTEAGRPLSELRRDVERYQASGEINFPIGNVRRAMRTVEDSIFNAAVDRLDGLTMDLGDGWFNLRPSNTEPMLRLNVEAPTREGVDAIVQRVSKILETQP